jgi:hypothetical protein
MFAISIVSILYGLLLSSITENTEKVMTLVPLALLPQIMLAGVLSRITDTKVELLSYLTISRWGTEGFSVIQKEVSNRIAQIGADKELIESFKKENATELLRSNFHETMFEDLFGKYSDSIRPDLIALLVLSLLFLTVIALALRSKDSIKN